MLDLDAIPDFLYPEQDGHRSCAGCGAIPGRGHAPIGHAPTVPCPVDVIEQLERDRRQTRRQLHAAWKVIDAGETCAHICSKHGLDDANDFYRAKAAYDKVAGGGS